MSNSITSSEAWHSLTTTALSNSEKRVLSVFDASKQLTRQQIADAAGLPLASVCGRANSLMAKGVLICRGYVVSDSGRRQECLGFPVIEQADFFK